MKIRAKIRAKGLKLETWTEDLEVDDNEIPEEAVKNIIRRFNLSLKPGEVPREMVSVSVIDANTIKEHLWEKQNLVTKADRIGMYDEIKCKRCTVVARRYGIGHEDIRRIGKFKNRKFSRCDDAMKALGIEPPLPIRGRKRRSI